MTGLYRQQATRDIVVSTETSNFALTQILSNTLWPSYGPFLSSTQSLTDRALAQSPTIQNLNQEVIDQLAGLPVLKVKIYDLEGRTVYSTDAEQIGDDKSGSSGFLGAKKGQITSQLGHRDTFQAVQDLLENRHLLSSYIPIRENGDRGNIVGVFEVYTDVTPLIGRIQGTQRQILVSSLLILSGLYAALVYFVFQANRLITQQYQQVVESEDRYRQQSAVLENTLQDLRAAQAQIIQAAKMSSLGQMVAGIAHEINNPIGFIKGNIAPLTTYFQDLIELLKAYQTEYPEPSSAISELQEDIDLAFVFTDAKKTLTSIHSGTERVRDIVVSLRNYSRLDEAVIKDADLHEGINNTLLIFNHRIGPVVEVVKDYGTLPLVRCSPSQLNQVFTQIIANALDAMLDADSALKRLAITTHKRSDNQVQISFRDSGPGMSPAVKAKIFDPFFTTKAVGKGTGLGMGICMKIVEQHQGGIDVETQLGEGTCITITLPV
ncbi:MAG: ATP-binding protein, partial [Cyanobacteria bacterium J06627_15]